MRYAKGSLVLSTERDVPLLRQIRNSKFVSHSQLFEYMKLGGYDRSRNSFNWRLKRLVDSGTVSISPKVFGAGSAVYQITKVGIAVLEHQGEFTTALHSRTEHLPHQSQAFHALQLNAVQLALARKNLLAGWQSEIEVASYNSVSEVPFAKDYDAIVDVWLGENTVRFALEYERTLKNQREYRAICDALEAEMQIRCVLYLTPNTEILIRLMHQFGSVHRRVAFANARTFAADLLDTRVLTSHGQPTVFRSLVQ
jgi:hypothetical protein